LFYVG